MEIVFDACKNDYFIDGEIKKNNSQQQSVESPPPRWAVTESGTFSVGL